MPRGRKNKRQAGGRQDRPNQAKRPRESRQDEVEVVQLQPHPNPGSGPATGRQGNVDQAQKGPSSTSNVIDFERIFLESSIAPQSSQLQTGPLQSSTSNSNGSVPNTDSIGNDRPLQSGPSNSNESERSVNFNFGEESLRLGSEDISCHVPHQISQKICSNQYINISLLLKGAVELQNLCLGGLVHVTNKGFLESRPEIVKDKVPSIEKWTDAFLIFSSIYLKKFPDKTQELLQYMCIIREAASRSNSFAWRSYDEQFRIRQASNLQSWGKLNPDLWLRVMSSNSFSQPEPTRVTKANCLDFNNGFCNFNPCRFTHACSHCGGFNHGRLTCFKLSANQSRGVQNFRPSRGFNPHFRGGKTFSRRGNKQ